jgi:hypothetical protein
MTDLPYDDMNELDQTFADCQKLLKQIEVEGIIFMSDDSIRARVS